MDVPKWNTRPEISDGGSIGYISIGIPRFFLYLLSKAVNTLIVNNTLPHYRNSWNSPCVIYTYKITSWWYWMSLYTLYLETIRLHALIYNCILIPWFLIITLKLSSDTWHWHWLSHKNYPWCRFKVRQHINMITEFMGAVQRLWLEVLLFKERDVLIFSLFSGYSCSCSWSLQWSLA